MNYPDLSNYNHVTDWAKVKKTCPFLVGRATQGVGTKNTANLKNGVDVYLDAFIKGCEANKIPYWLYCYLEKGNEKKQAEYMVKICEGKIGAYFRGYCLDIEDGNTLAGVTEALTYIKTQSEKTMLYIGQSFYAQAGFKKLIDNRGAQCAWWCARYGKDTGKYDPAYPVPDGVDLHQYTSKCSVDGISGKCDDNRLTGTKSEAWFTSQKEEKMAKVIIGSARIDEKGKATGGLAGDQTGKEVATENYYTHSLGWVLLRAKDKKVAEKLAYAMKAACDNANIGYDQGQRNTLYTAASKVGFDPAKVKTKVETDCSALVRVCLAYAGIKVADFNTSTEVKVIMATGKFDKITSFKESDLQAGDILDTKKKGHTVIVVSGATTSTSTNKTTASSTASKAPNKTIKKYGTVTAHLLNVRTWAGKENPLVGFTKALPYGTKVGICDTVKAANGDPWYYIKHNGHYGFVSAAWIK